MLQCTAIRRLPPSATLAAMEQADDQPEEPLLFSIGHAMCELAGPHHSNHAFFLWETEQATKGVWFRWADHTDSYSFTPLPWCTAEDPSGLTCTLFADHDPPEHSWEVTDPTREALLADITAHPERYGLPPGSV